MYVKNFADDYDNITFNNSTNKEKEDKNIISNYLLQSKPRSILLFSLLSSLIYTLIKPLRTNK